MDLSKVRILVVEDNPDLLSGSARLLERAGYSVARASNGQESLRAVQDHRPHLVLLDCDLPGLDGLEICRRIKRDPGLVDTFVIMVSDAPRGSEPQPDGVECGADGHFIRPMDSRELLVRVESYARMQNLSSFLRQDVAERKGITEAMRESKSRWEFAVESTGLGVLDWDIGSEEISFSDGWLSLTGYAREEIAPRLEFLTALVHPDDLPMAMADIKEVLAGRKAVHVIEHRLRHCHGHWLWLQSRSLVSAWSEEGEPLRMIGTHLDITERKRAEEERIALEHKLLLAQKDASLGLMAGGIAHQFNNLLAIILGNLELAREEVDPDVAEMLTDALNATRQAAVVSRSLLGYLGQGVRHLEKSNLALQIADMRPLLQLALPTNVRLEFDLASHPLWATVDLSEFRHMVLSLVTNGSEAVAAQGGLVRVRAQSAVGDFVGLEPWTCLEVCDDGPGMDAATQQKMFDPYFSTKFTGRGMGLAVTLGIVRAHSGLIQVDSAPGCGTTVKVYLPQSGPAQLAADLL